MSIISLWLKLEFIHSDDHIFVLSPFVGTEGMDREYNTIVGDGEVVCGDQSGAGYVGGSGYIGGVERGVGW